LIFRNGPFVGAFIQKSRAREFAHPGLVFETASVVTFIRAMPNGLRVLPPDRA
jgi:hypothetical protein